MIKLTTFFSSKLTEILSSEISVKFRWNFANYNKPQVCNLICKNYSHDYFHVKISTHCFFTDHLNHKIVNKTTCWSHSANRRQLWTLSNFRTVAIIFGGFQDFLIYLAKYFWSLLSSPNLITQQYFAIAM